MAGRLDGSNVKVEQMKKVTRMVRRTGCVSPLVLLFHLVAFDSMSLVFEKKCVAEEYWVDG